MIMYQVEECSWQLKGKRKYQARLMTHWYCVLVDFLVENLSRREQHQDRWSERGEEAEGVLSLWF